MIINVSTPYPIFTRGQQLKSSSLTGIVDFAAMEDQDTRVYLEGAGIFYGLMVDWDATNGTLKLSPGTAVTSDGQLFALEDEIIYRGIRRKDNQDLKVELMKREVTVIALTPDNVLHDEFVSHISGPDTNEYLLILAVSSDQSSEASCLYGFENNENKKTQAIELALINKNQFTQAELDAWFVTDQSQAGDKDPVMQRFGFLQDQISFERFTDREKLTTGFSEVCAAAEQSIGDAYKQLYDLVKSKLTLNTVNPFNDLTARLAQLRDEIASSRFTPWLYDYYRDLIAAYQEFVSTDIFSFLSFIPDKDRFRGYVALGSIRTRNGQQQDINYRMGLYRPPFADLSLNALEKPRLLMQRMVWLATTTNTRLADDGGVLEPEVRFTPDAGLNKVLSDRAIPFYYKEKTALSKVWNTTLTRNNRTFTIPGITDEQDKKYFLANIDSYNFYRIKGHISGSIRDTQDAIVKQRAALHLPFDIRVVYLGAEDEMRELILDRSASFSDLRVMLEKIVDDILCARTCSDNFIELIFKGEFLRDEPGLMFERLFELFGDRSLEENLKIICENRQICDDIVCCTAQVTSLFALYQEYARRKTELVDGLLFHRFAVHHPGLEHSGGVPRGGTLVLVCARKDINLLTENDKKRLATLMATKDTALFEEFAEELLNYEVVADFCLPYICCSSQPSIKLDLEAAPPIAKWVELKREIFGQNEGYRVTLINESLRGNIFNWKVYDADNKELESRDVFDSSDQWFDFKFATGLNYKVRLRATRGDMWDEYEGPIVICPGTDVVLTSNGKDDVDWNITNVESKLPIEPSPYGGVFSLTVTSDSGTDEIVPEDEYVITWDKDKKKATLGIIQPLVATYQLHYVFGDCEGAEATLTFVTITNASKDEQTPSEKADSFENRKKDYIAGVNTVAVDDAELAAGTQNYLAGNGDYDSTIAGLQAGYAKLKAAQKTLAVKLMVYATAYFVDQQLIASPDKVSAAVKKQIKVAADTIISHKEGVGTWNAVWTTEDISTEENKKSLSTYKGLIA